MSVSSSSSSSGEELVDCVHVFAPSEEVHARRALALLRLRAGSDGLPDPKGLARRLTASASRAASSELKDEIKRAAEALEKAEALPAGPQRRRWWCRVALRHRQAMGSAVASAAARTGWREGNGGGGGLRLPGFLRTALLQYAVSRSTAPFVAQVATPAVAGLAASLRDLAVVSRLRDGPAASLLTWCAEDPQPLHALVADAAVNAAAFSALSAAGIAVSRAAARSDWWSHMRGRRPEPPQKEEVGQEKEEAEAVCEALVEHRLRSRRALRRWLKEDRGGDTARTDGAILARGLKHDAELERRRCLDVLNRQEAEALLEELRGADPQSRHQHHPQRCTALTRRGTRCTQPAARGGTLCARFHAADDDRTATAILGSSSLLATQAGAEAWSPEQLAVGWPVDQGLGCSRGLQPFVPDPTKVTAEPHATHVSFHKVMSGTTRPLAGVQWVRRPVWVDCRTGRLQGREPEALALRADTHLVVFLLYLRWDDTSAHANAVLVRQGTVTRFDPGRWTPDAGCRADTHAMEIAERLWPVGERRVDRSACVQQPTSSWFGGERRGPQTLAGGYPADRFCVGWVTLFAATAALNPESERGSDVLVSCLPDHPPDLGDAAGLRRLQVRATQRVASWVRHCEDRGWVGR